MDLSYFLHIQKVNQVDKGYSLIESMIETGRQINSWSVIVQVYNLVGEPIWP